MPATSAPAQAGRRAKPKTLLVLTQVYVPDPASVGQHLHDAAAQMARRGYRVVVLAAQRGYNDPSRKYPRRERRDGVDIRRLPLSSFGKKSIGVRLLAQTVFVVLATLGALCLRRLDGVLVSTSPPFCPVAALVIQFLRRVPVTHWAMDLNPDQMIAMGYLKPRSLVARSFDLVNRMILRRAARIVALDRYMAQRLEAKLPAGNRMIVMPPWPHVTAARPPVAHRCNPFRSEHGLQDRFVIMYSGNHGLPLPLATFLEAAVSFKHDPQMVFVFIGDGVRKQEVNATISEHGMTNMLSLPYQPIDNLPFSLAAADVHLVTMADNMVGVIHPCKIYGAMAVGRPILLVGPDRCHISDIINEHGVGWQIRHGDVDGAIKLIDRMRRTAPDTLACMGQRARQVVQSRFSKQTLCDAFCNVIEQALGVPAN